MSLFSYLKGIYALDTLDTRFTNSSKVPYKSAAETRNDLNKASNPPANLNESASIKRAGESQLGSQPSKWRTPEFYVYYFIFIVTVPYMFWVVYDVSRPSDPQYHKYEHLLSPGWIPGRKIDVSDNQYETFRENIPYMGLLLIFHPILRKLFEKFSSVASTTLEVRKTKANGKAFSHRSSGEARLEQRASFDAGFALIFLSALHGFSVLKILLILYLNFCIATRLPRNLVVPATWIFNIGTLFANELSKGYHFTDIGNLILPGSGWGTWLDSYNGIMPRWEILFNITVLRLISFNMDYYWNLDRRAGSPVEKKQLDPTNLSELDRIRISAKPTEYSFRNYLAYTIYAPLYLVGPIITFNEYISQSKYTPASIENSRTIKYGIRFFLALLCMELVLHFDYCVAIFKGDPNWADYSPVQLSLMSYFNLHIVWLKLLLPWRLFRFWSLLDGIDPPENMLRCASDNYSTTGFWRSWHRSYSRWLLRYLYIPLGGSRNSGTLGMIKSGLNYLLVFTFVALWHDINLNLLIWGWMIVFFMAPEMLAGYIFPKKKWENNPTMYRYMCAAGGVFNVLLMMIANMVGFTVGVDGMKSILTGILHDISGITFLVIACSAVFVGVQVMFEIRESELRQGIKLRC